MYLPVVQTVYLPANIVFYYFKLISVSFSKTALSVVPGEGRQMFCKNKKKNKRETLFHSNCCTKICGTLSTARLLYRKSGKTSRNLPWMIHQQQAVLNLHCASNSYPSSVAPLHPCALNCRWHMKQDRDNLVEVSRRPFSKIQSMRNGRSVILKRCHCAFPCKAKMHVLLSNFSFIA